MPNEELYVTSDLELRKFLVSVSCITYHACIMWIIYCIRRIVVVVVLLIINICVYNKEEDVWN